MDKIEKDSLNIVNEKIEFIKRTFPEAIVDGKIDFEILRILLGDIIEDNNEKYKFSWNGKVDAIKFAQTPSVSTLIPLKNKSAKWENTENIYIEGDNLEVLKLLQKTYHSKIKVIYIDPPYNTGEDFVYADNFKDSLQNYKDITQQSSRANAETNGRFHTNWLNMMYSRLMLAKNLLNEKGFIFIHIDEHEDYELRFICKEIFGENNELGTIIWDKRNPKGDTVGVAYQHESILVYAKNKDALENSDFTKKKENAEKMIKFVKELIAKYGGVSSKVREEYKKWIKDNKTILSGGEAAYSLIDDSGRIYRQVSMAAPDKPETRSHRPLIHPVTKKPCPVPAKGWRYIDTTMDEMLENGKIDFGIDESTQPTNKYYLDENMNEMFSSLLYYGGSDTALDLPFDNPKPIYVVKKILDSVCKENDIVLDFFAGSSTTAHAILQLNAEDDGNRKFIMVQLPELCDEKTVAFKNGFKNICEIGEERIRRAGQKIYNELKEKYLNAGLLVNECINPDDLDLGFKVFKLESTNIKPWDGENKVNENTIFDFTDTIKEDRTNLDVAYEIMLKYGIFNMPLKEVLINNKTMYNIGDGYMNICLDNNITAEDVVEIAKQKPHCVVFKEKGFEDDNVKINATYTLERMGVEDVKCI